MSNTHSIMQELCPDCGDFVNSLNEQTGFCESCSSPSAHTIPQHKVSSREVWLVKYADDVEDVMALYELSALEATALVLSKKKAQCVICGEYIAHGTFGRHFICNKNPKCRKARRKYKYLIYDKNLTKQEALSAILEWSREEHDKANSD